MALYFAGMCAKIAEDLGVTVEAKASEKLGYLDRDEEGVAVESSALLIAS